MDINRATLGGWDIFVIVFYFLLVLGIGFFGTYRAKRGTISGYFLAGHYMTWLPVGASLFASNIGSVHFIGLTGSGAAGGIGVGIYELSAIITLQVLGWIFLPVYIASGVRTLPEYMGKRFGGERIRTYLAVLSLLMYIFVSLSVDLFSGAIFMSTFFGWNVYAGVLLVLGMTVLTTISGGLTAVMYTETLQCSMMVLGGFFVCIYSFVEVGGLEGVMKRYWTAIPNDTSIYNNTCGIPSPDSFRMLRGVDDTSFPWLGFVFGLAMISIYYWIADQLIVQRALAAKDISHAQGGTIFTGYLKILPVFLMVIPGMISRILYPDEVACVSNCKEICGSEHGCSNIAFPKLVLDLMPVGFRGLMFAVMIAALMGNISAIFNSSSTIFTMDIYSKIRRSASTVELLIVGRVFVAIMVLISISWMPIIERHQNGQVFMYIQSLLSYMAPPVAAAFILAILWPRCNETGVFYALITGLVIGVIRMALDFAYPAPPCGSPDLRPLIVSKVHFMYFAMLLAALTAIVIVVVSLCTVPPDPKQLVRTTFWSRKNKQIRDDDDTELQHFAQSSSANLDTGSGLNSDSLKPVQGQASPASKIKKSLKRACFWLCGYTQTREETAVLDSHLKQIRSLDQAPWQTAILLANTVLLLMVSVGLITFFSLGMPVIAERYKPNPYPPVEGTG